MTKKDLFAARRAGNRTIEQALPPFKKRLETMKYRGVLDKPGFDDALSEVFRATTVAPL